MFRVVYLTYEKRSKDILYAHLWMPEAIIWCTQHKTSIMTAILQLILACGFIIGVCFGTYKLVLPICLKIIDLCFESYLFRMAVSIFLALAFCAVGIMQLIDFTKEIEHGLSCFFPLSFLVSAFFLFMTLKKQKV